MKKKVFIGIIVLGALLLLFSSSNNVYAEKVQLHFDDRQWEVGYNAKNNEQGIIEYVLKGESVSAWSELVTAQIMFGLQTKVSAREYMEDMEKNIKKMCPNAKWDVIVDGANDILFEWQVADIPNYADQYEITRIINGNEGIHIIHYATKKPPISSERRSEWIKLLKSATLVSYK